MTNFELVSDLQSLQRRDFGLADNSLINPNNANPLMDGEFLALDADYKLVRGSTQGLGYALFMEKGRYDVQAIKKTMVLFSGGYEANTRVYKPAGLALGAALMIDAAVTVDSLTKSGLALHTGGIVIGYVTRLPASNGNRLRFQQTLF